MVSKPNVERSCHSFKATRPEVGLGRQALISKCFSLSIDCSLGSESKRSALYRETLFEFGALKVTGTDTGHINRVVILSVSNTGCWREGTTGERDDCSESKQGEAKKWDRVRLNPAPKGEERLWPAPGSFRPTDTILSFCPKGHLSSRSPYSFSESLVIK